MTTNRRAIKLFGVEEKDLTSRPLASLIARIEGEGSNGSDQRYLARLCKGRDETTLVSVLLRPLDSEGKTVAQFEPVRRLAGHVRVLNF